MIKKLKLLFWFIVLTPCFVFAQSTPPSVSVSPYVIAIKQPDGSALRIIGKVEKRIAYTETEDGYTILKNDRDIYEYAIRASDGNLQASGIKAKDASERSEKEESYISKITKHLRYESPYLQIILKKLENKPYSQ